MLKFFLSTKNGLSSIIISKGLRGLRYDEQTEIKLIGKGALTTFYVEWYESSKFRTITLPHESSLLSWKSTVHLNTSLPNQTLLPNLLKSESSFWALWPSRQIGNSLFANHPNLPFLPHLVWSKQWAMEATRNRDKGVVTSYPAHFRMNLKSLPNHLMLERERRKLEMYFFWAESNLIIEAKRNPLSPSQSSNQKVNLVFLKV